MNSSGANKLNEALLSDLETADVEMCYTEKHKFF